jgi:hypothetical protein
MGTGSFPGVKRPRRGADHPPLLVPRLRMGIAISLPPLQGHEACNRGKFTFLAKENTELLVLLYTIELKIIDNSP